MNSKELNSILPKVFLLLVLASILSCATNTNQDNQSNINMEYLFQGSRLYAFGLSLQNFPENERDSVINDFIREYPTTPIFESDTVVSLYWYGKADQVLIYSDLHGWSVPDTLNSIPCGGFTFFHKSYILPFDARIDYQFQIDTLFTIDERNPSITPSGYGPHSEIAMPGFKPDPIRQHRQDILHGSLDSLLLVSKSSDIQSRKAMVYLPYGIDSLDQLPVLYVLDGLEAIEYMSYPTVLDNLIADGKIEPLIVVFIPPVERHVEFIGEKHDDFLAVLCDEFVPHVDKTYKTQAQPEKRGITGISSGGHFALLAVLSRPDVFLCGAGQSPTMSNALLEALHNFSSEKINYPSLHFYFDVGRFDLANGTINNQTFLEANEHFSRELTSAGISYR
ncbi:MAG: esterase family protein, partial [Bacteroidales bacterium]|nr:esterase family protein [Bacteroidales bacterium]